MIPCDHRRSSEKEVCLSCACKKKKKKNFAASAEESLCYIIPPQAVYILPSRQSRKGSPCNASATIAIPDTKLGL